MMDRAKKDELPKMQGKGTKSPSLRIGMTMFSVGFIDSICLPLYQMLAEAEPGLRPLLDGCKTNRENWEKLQEERDKLSKARRSIVVRRSLIF